MNKKKSLVKEGQTDSVSQLGLPYVNYLHWLIISTLHVHGLLLAYSLIHLKPLLCKNPFHGEASQTVLQRD
jgi:hypothetical protein